MMTTDRADRKGLPLYSGCVAYFPEALVAVAELSRIGNDQHNPGAPLHWDRSKSQDELDALMRHLIEAGTIDTDGVRHSTKVAWRALANLQKELENARASSETNNKLSDDNECCDLQCDWIGNERCHERADSAGSPAGAAGGGEVGPYRTTRGGSK